MGSYLFSNIGFKIEKLCRPLGGVGIGYFGPGLTPRVNHISPFPFFNHRIRASCKFKLKCFVFYFLSKINSYPTGQYLINRSFQSAASRLPNYRPKGGTNKSFKQQKSRRDLFNANPLIQ